MPMFNASPYLRECIDSVLAQTYADFELLIVDDGSEDDSVDIIRSYTDSRIRLIERRHDYIASLNCLFDEARGTFVAHMDADDVMKPDRLKAQLIYLETHPEIDILASQMDNFQGLPLSGAGLSEESTEVFLEDLSDGCPIAHPSVMIRIARLRQAGLHYEAAYVYAEDYNLWAEALMAGMRIAVLNRNLSVYRRTRTQVSFKYGEEQSRQTRRIREKIIQRLYSSPFKDSAAWGCHRHKVLPPLPGNRLTVIMPFLNERDEVVHTLESIRQSAGDEVEILVINDCSDDGFNYREAVAHYRVSYIVNDERMGVAASRDMGVTLCRTPYFILLDAHMRFYDSQWPSHLVSLLQADDRVLLCCQSRFLGRDAQGRVIRRECPDGYGAVSVFRENSFWPDIEWNLHEQFPDRRVEPIAHVLGAGYAASCRYWTYLKGLTGLRKYGSDEAYISFKVWREGGRCLLVKDVVAGHIYRSQAPYRRYAAEELYNSLLVSYLTFSQPWHCMAAAVGLHKDYRLYTKAAHIMQANRDDVEKLKDYLDSIYTRTFEEVLQIHRACLRLTDTADSAETKLRQTDDIVHAHPANTPGLYDGKMGQLIWHCQYESWKGGDGSSAVGQQLWGDVEHAVKSRQLSWNFSQGLAGVGWGIIYLFTRNYVDNYPVQLLRDIDRQLEEVALLRTSPGSISLGLGGILAYAVLRILTGEPAWKNAFSEELRRAALRTVDSPASDVPSLYYALYYLDLQKRGNMSEDYKPRISEWRPRDFVLPQNPLYWKPSLYDGCTGAFIGLLDNENKKKHYA